MANRDDLINGKLANDIVHGLNQAYYDVKPGDHVDAGGFHYWTHGLRNGNVTVDQVDQAYAQAVNAG